MDILKDQWSPVYTLKSTLMSLRSLLCSPEPNDPQDAEVAKHYTSDFEGYERTARYWTEIFAKRDNEQSSVPPSDADEAQLVGLDPKHVEKFVNMGFAKSRVIEVMRRLNYRGQNIQNITDEQVTSLLSE